ncbi:MAG: exodeoxyribonuclease III [Candidatus Woesebacteria bacterium]|jgi:exodeoxyribonuclease-3
MGYTVSKLKSIKLLSWNVNGLRAVYKKGFLNFLKKEKPDILCLQETKAQDSQLGFDFKEIPGYQVFFSSAKKKGYSGVATYTRIKPKAIDFSLGIERFDQEGRVIKADFASFILFNVYFPNGKLSKERLQYKMDFYAVFLKIVKSLKKQGKKIIVCGDVNTAHKAIDLARPKENKKISGFLPKERAWIDKFLAAGFLDTFRVFNQEPDHYTWWSMRTRARKRNVGWRIDYFFIDKSLKKQLDSAFILNEVMGSDHCPIGIKFKYL